MSNTIDFNKLREKISVLVGPPTFSGGKKQKPVLNQQFFAKLADEVYKPIYEKTEEEFYIYSPETGLWEHQNTATMLERLSDLMMRFANATGDTFVNSKRDVNTIRQILSFMKSDQCCGRENAFARKDTDEPFIHCGNGVITFPRKEDGRRIPVLVEFDPKFMSRNRTDINFREDAVCPEFLDRLLKPAMTQDDINHFQLCFGQCLLGVNDSQTILLIIGKAGGGKSTAVNIVEKVIKRKNCTELRLKHMADSRFETQRLLGKTLLTAKDVPSNFLNSSGAYMLKALTGKDTVTIEHKGSNDASDVCCAFNVIITANKTLRIAVDGDADAWKRRIIIVNFNNAPHPKDKIPNFDDYLLAREGEGIVRWAVDGAVLLLENDGKIKKTETQENKVNDLLQESDPLTDFVKSCLVQEEDSDVTTAELVESFYTFCNERGWLLLPQRVIENRLPDYVYESFGLSKRTDIRRCGKNHRGYRGLRLT